MKEIELLFKLDDTKASTINKALRHIFIEELEEIDVYLYPPHKNYNANGQGRENLRIRTSSGRKELCYKRVFYKDGEYDYAIEKSVSIMDDKKILDILKVIGFRAHFIVEKERKVFKDDHFKYTIDKVKNLGLFLEIEWLQCGDDESKVRDAILKRAHGFGLSIVQDKGYLRLLEEKII